jgi:omega-6 fatty acid desaturase (delta-12 desaturase)
MRSPVTSLPADPRQWSRALARYRDPSDLRSAVELAITALPLIALWLTMWASLHFVGYWLVLLLSIPAAGFLVRLFMIQHDCSHGAFFGRRSVNDWVGRIIGVFTLTPHDSWRHSHTLHHAGSGNLDHRGIGDVTTKTVAEYRALGWRGKLAYRAYRNPIVLFLIGPAYLFLLQHRLPVGSFRLGWRSWVSTMATNVGIAALAAGLIWLTGFGTFLLVHLPITVVAASIGVWLFYVQHQFEHTSWERDPDWSHPEASLHGSSHYDLPAVLRWFSANIGIHHVHHLASRIPYYRLPEVLRDHPELAGVGRLTLLQSLGCVKLVLWDEGRKRLVSFREMRRNARADRGGLFDSQGAST